jgi:hypothetical protein
MILQHIQAHLRASLPADAPRVGPFLLNYAPDTDNVFRNYAVPASGAAPTADDVADLVAWFAAHRRTPRLEYVAPAEDVESALVAAGFAVERRLPLMYLHTLVTPTTPDGTELLLATTDDDLQACARVQNSAYGEGEGEPSAADMARLAGTNARGGAVALAVVAGVPASSGVLTGPKDGLAELAAIGTLAGYRRRGLASCVAARLSQVALDRGVTPYLQAESAREAALYGRLGYLRVGELTLVNGPTR